MDAREETMRAAGVARIGNMCGALSGSVMGLGIRYGRSTPETSL